MPVTIPDEVIESLLDTGSVEACGLEFTPEAAAAAMHVITQRAPEEIRPSWPMVLQYARLQAAYRMAKDLGDTKGMRDAANDSRALLQSVY